MKTQTWTPKNKTLVVAAFAGLLAVSNTPAANLWTESINGDLSNNQAAPNAFVLGNGVNSVIGSVAGGPDTQDWIALTVPVGFNLSSVVLASYTSGDAQGFTGVQAGTAFVGSPGVAGSYLGYAHFGTGAQNGPLAATNLVGANILPIMGSTTTAPGSAGFTPPLGSGSYVFLIQQTGGSCSYEFDYNVTPVPEPASLMVLSLAGGLALFRYRRSHPARTARPANEPGSGVV